MEKKAKAEAKRARRNRLKQGGDAGDPSAIQGVEGAPLDGDTETGAVAESPDNTETGAESAAGADTDRPDTVD